MAKIEFNPEFPNVSGLNPAEAAAAAGDNAVIKATPADVEPLLGEVTDENIEPLEVYHEPFEEQEVAMDMPSVVNDDMSFAQAFSAARQAMGPGGSFMWHGQVYGTFYENEWNSMSPAQQQQWSASAIGNSHGNDGLNFGETDTNGLAYNEVYDNSDVEFDDDSQITILGVESVENDGEIVNLATFDIDGQEVVMVDLDNDSVFDYAIGDFDNSGEVLDSLDDIIPIEDMGLTVDDVAMAMDHQNQFDLPDDYDMAADMDTTPDMDIF